MQDKQKIILLLSMITLFSISSARAENDTATILIDSTIKIIKIEHQDTIKEASITQNPVEMITTEAEKTDTAAIADVEKKTAITLNLGTIKVNTTPAGASVILNNINAGITPYQRSGFQHGYYEVQIRLDNYDAIKKIIQIQGSDTIKIDTTLKYQLGGLAILSEPIGAVVSINNQSQGVTPFFSGKLQPGPYELKVELNGYAPVRKQLSVKKDATDTVVVTLTTLASIDSVKTIAKKRFRMIRRIGFGAISCAFAGGCYSVHQKYKDELLYEKGALNRYNSLGNGTTTAQFDEAWEYYQSSVKDTDKYARQRNALGILSGIFAAGFIISIPF
jgi:hypothetical protein